MARSNGSESERICFGTNKKNNINLLFLLNNILAFLKVCAPRTGERVTGRCFYGRGNLASFEQYNPWNEGIMKV